MAHSKLVLPVQAVAGGKEAAKPGMLEIGTDWEKSGVTDTAKISNPNGYVFVI